MSGLCAAARRVITTLVIAGAALLAGAAVASAATITVTSPGDTGGSCPSVSSCTLRDALAQAHSDATPDTIVIGAGTYTITHANGPLVVNPGADPLTITGAGSGSTELTQSGGTGLMKIDSGATVTISGVNFHGGVAAAGSNGGAINNDGTLSLTSDSFSANSALGQTSGGADGADGGYGGAIYNDGVLSVAGSTFSTNVTDGGGAGTEYGGEGSYGGAIYNDDALTLTGSAFTGNEADGGSAAPQSGAGSGSGGAIYSDYGPTTIATSTFDGNEAMPGAGASYTYGDGSGGEGGAIYVEESTLVVSSSSFGAVTPNQAVNSAAVTYLTNSWSGDSGEGGAVYADSSNATFNADTFSSNLADGSPAGSVEGGYGGDAGAIYNGYGQLTINGGSFTANQAEGATATGSTEQGYQADGGAIYGYDGTMIISGASFTNNRADGGEYGSSYGGGGGQGGAIDVNGGELSLFAASFSGNTAVTGSGKPAGTENYDTAAYGGALLDNGYVQANGTTFTGNSATASSIEGTPGGAGGAVFLQEGGIGSFTDDSFSSNNAAPGGTSGSPSAGYGGAIASDGGGLVTMTSDAFTSNTAPNGDGGALNIESPASLITSTLSSNSAEYGGGVEADGLPFAIVNSTIDGNTAEATSPVGDGEGGGVYLDGGTLTLASDTLLANQAYGSDAGGNLYQDGPLTVHDTIIAEGSLLGGGSGNENCYINGEGVTDLGYNFEDANQCGFSATGDLVNQSDADLGSLASNGGPTQTVALLAGSTAIDAGDPAGCTDALGNVLGTDQRGTARPQGPRCDIGAYEYVPPATPAPTPPQGTPPTPVAPALSGLSFSPGVFLSVNGGGSTIVYNDSEAASTSFTVTGTFAGYKLAKGSCKALPKSGRRPKHSSACTRTVTEDSFSHQDVAGANSVVFAGRPNGQTLPKGTYTLSAKPSFDGLTGAIQTTTFKIAS